VEFGEANQHRTNNVTKRRAIGTIKRDREAHKFVIRQYESTGYDFDDGNCRGEN